jgi:Fic family protein
MTPETASTGHPNSPEAVTSPDVLRILGEYNEMPGLTLTVRQAARLWDLGVSQSQRLLRELVESRFLIEDSSGRYRRRGYPRCC